MPVVVTERRGSASSSSLRVERDGRRMPPTSRSRRGAGVVVVDLDVQAEPLARPRTRSPAGGGRSASARSARVRPGVVTGIAGVRQRDGRRQWPVYRDGSSWSEHPLAWATVTSILGASERRRPQRAAALRWLSDGVRAARQHRREVGAVAAQDGVADGETPRWSRCSRPAPTRRSDRGDVEPKDREAARARRLVLTQRRVRDRWLWGSPWSRTRPVATPRGFSPTPRPPSMPGFVPRPARYPPRREALPRHHVRLPDERARLRAHEGHARVARLRARRRRAPTPT